MLTNISNESSIGQSPVCEGVWPEAALRRLGLSEAQGGGRPGLARVLSAHRGRWLVAGDLSWKDHGEDEERGFPVALAALSGRLIEHDDLPVTGDWVVLRPQAAPGPELLEIIDAILPRATWLSREAAGGAGREQLLAANIDTVLCVMAMGQNYNPSRMERYLSAAWESGAQPIVVITKVDTEEPGEAVLAEIGAIAQGLPFVFCSSLSGQGLDALDSLLRPGKTAVLMGSSGAGKSTLLNALAGRRLMESSAISEAMGKGRHTTVSRELFALPSGALIIDTPGMRELALSCDGAAVDAAFTDVDTLSVRCRFSDCSHTGEPGCAVQAAIDEGAMEERRLKNWHKQRRETERRQSLARTVERRGRARSRKGDPGWRWEERDE